VAELGKEVTGLAIGQRVVALVCWGAYADEVVIDATTVVAIPDDLPDDAAAAFPVAYGTAFLCLHQRARIQPGETVIVTGANGNVGYAAVQVARRLGATRVIAVTRKGTEDIPQADIVLAAGESLATDLAAYLGEDKAHVLLDLVGGQLFAQLLDALAWEARVVTAGYSSGEIPTVSLVDVLVRNISILGEDIAGYTVLEPSLVGSALRTLVQWYEQGTLQPRGPVAVHPLPEASKALQKVVDGTAGGKLVLTTS
jgi:NADPH2:quinone reductase